MKLAKGKVTESIEIINWPGRKMLTIMVGDQRIHQTTLANVSEGAEIEVDLATARIYKGGKDITHLPNPVVFTGTVERRPDGRADLTLDP